ncbi:hypothetical protein CVN56_31165 [Rhodococcus sp. AQ5-07]|nr:hypothetical protein CVN56_31165 [Rhodococcus sp. AQ5-07]
MLDRRTDQSPCPIRPLPLARQYLLTLCTIVKLTFPDQYLTATADDARRVTGGGYLRPSASEGGCTRRLARSSARIPSTLFGEGSCLPPPQ